MNLALPGETAAWVTEDWLRQFQAALYRCAQTQLVPDRDAHRLVALAMAMTLVSQQLLAEAADADRARPSLRALCAELAASASASEWDPPGLGDLTIVMDMAATAFSLIDHRRASLGGDEAELPGEAMVTAVLELLRRACQSGGARTAASVLTLLQRFGVTPA